MRSSYWGQGAHNALFLVGDMMQQAERAGVVDGKATFAAPHLREQEKPLMDRMGDWWNSVFNSSGSGDATVATVPEVKLPDVKFDPPQLEPPPRSIDTAQLPQQTPLPPPDAPVIATDAQRVPSFPRPLESTRSSDGNRPLDSARPVDSVPGTQVYRSPEATARMPDPSLPADVVRAPVERPSPPISYAPSGNRPTSSTAAMGAASGSTRSSSDTPVYRPPRESAPARERDSGATMAFPREGAGNPDSGSAGSAPSASSGGAPDASGSPSSGETQ